ncbi:hypothetical protein Scep_012348 [Stephania cephalantha]|uniref:Uncharacterized protein n=1 Tax=Stephania cephalantha TaxID=152367 RepID=A0AAP0P9F8_9MAGN
MTTSGGQRLADARSGAAAAGIRRGLTAVQRCSSDAADWRGADGQRPSSSGGVAARAARQRQRRLRRGEWRGGALSTGRMRDLDEIATTRWGDLGVGCRVRNSRRERDIFRFAISRGADLSISRPGKEKIDDYL